MRLARERLIMGMKLSNRNHHHMAIMYIDLDGFKKINDTHGHDVGDQVLRVVAKALNSTIRQTDTAARLGGDEFLMLITEIHDRSEARLVAEKIVEAVSRPINLENGQQVSVGASIGIALYPDDADDAEKLLKKADDAMFFIKASGKNNFAFTSHIAHDVPEQEPRPDPESES
jgi:diguanylate cyclase (GGDEF)-like protein